MKSSEDRRRWFSTLVTASVVIAPFTPSHIFLSTFPTAFPYSLNSEKTPPLADTLHSCHHVVWFSFAGGQVMDASLSPSPNPVLPTRHPTLSRDKHSSEPGSNTKQMLEFSNKDIKITRISMSKALTEKVDN